MRTVIAWMEPVYAFTLRKRKKMSRRHCSEFPLEPVIFPVYSVNMTMWRLSPPVPPKNVPISMKCAYLVPKRDQTKTLLGILMI